MSTCQFFLVGDVYLADLHGGNGVGNDKAFFCISGYCGNVTSRFSSLFYGIGNVFTGFLLVKVRPCVGPVVLCIQGNFLAAVHTVRFQLYLDCVWSVIVAVIVVNPCLGNGYAGLARCVAVGDIVAADFRCVIRNSILGYGVNNFFSCFIFRQVRKLVGPAASLICFHSLAVFLNSICKKSYDNALWALTILILCIIPGLGSADFGCLRFITVDEVISIHLGCITFNCILSYGVNDFLAICKFRQIGEAVSPVAKCICFYSLVLNLFAICKKIDDNAFRTFAILIVCVLPGLGSAKGRNRCGMSIGQGCNGSVCAVIGQFVSIWKIFLCPGVLDCFSVSLLRKTGYSLGPVVGCSQSRCCSCFFAICKKGYGDAIRTDSILVICISPQLGNGCTGLAWGVAVDDVVAIIGCGVVLYRGLAYGVGDFLAVCELRQIGKAVVPAAILACGYRLAVHFFSICKKFHGNALWAFTVLILCIIPGLGSADLGCFWYMGVDEVVAIQLGGVAFNSILGYGVSNFSILVVL